MLGWNNSVYRLTDEEAVRDAFARAPAHPKRRLEFAYDNAMAEAWVATFKSELVDGRRFPSFEHAEHETLDWIGFYNEERLHEELGDVPPAEHEMINYKRDNIRTLSAR